MSPNCTMRSVSTVAPQALTFMNGEFVLQHARRMADRVLGLGEKQTEERLLAAWRMALSRDPATDEIRRASVFVESQKTLLGERKHPAPESAAWAGVCHALLSSNEFLYVD
jgi:hypothetical protein